MFQKNQIYKRSNLHDEYGGNRQRGISNCVNHSFIFIFTNPNSDEQDVYIDEWKNKYFYYSGEGRRGDMTMTGGNKSIRDHKKNKKQIHLFEKTTKSGMWKYIDELKLVDIKDYRNDDEDGIERQSFQFVLLSVTEELKIEKFSENINHPSEYNFNIPNVTERKGLVISRVGQGYYRSQILSKWGGVCPVTGCNIKEILISSHIKKWSKCTDYERLDVENGILFSPNVDSLFDRNLISFSDEGEIICSTKIDNSTLIQLGIDPSVKIIITDGMKRYLDYHRGNLV